VQSHDADRDFAENRSVPPDEAAKAAAAFLQGPSGATSAGRSNASAPPALVGQALPPVRWEIEPELPPAPSGPWIGFVGLLAVAVAAMVMFAAARVMRRRDST